MYELEHVEDIYWEPLEAHLEVLSERGVVERFDAVGSFRRREATVGDLDVIVKPTEGTEENELRRGLTEWDQCDSLLTPDDSNLWKMSADPEGIFVDFCLTEERQSYGSFLHYLTGDIHHYSLLCEYADSRGYIVNKYGVFEKDGFDEEGFPLKGEKVGGGSEEDIYGIFGLPVPDPSERDAEWIDRHF